jgi:hypothetical protein
MEVLQTPENRPMTPPYYRWAKECKATHKRDTCIPTFIAALFIIAKL